MRGTVNGKRQARVASGLLAAGLLWFAGIGQAAPEIRWAKTYTPRVWTYACGTQMTAAYDTYKGGNVYLIMADDTRQTIAMHKLSAEDQAWVLDELKKPHGLINSVVFAEWQDQCPMFRVNVSFFSRGNLTESPVVCIQYLLLDQQNRAVKRICDPVVLYPTVGRQNLEKISTMVMKQCLGPREQDADNVKMLAYRAVMLLLHDNKKEWLVLDTILNQNDVRLREQRIPSDWWEPRYPAGVWPSLITGGTGGKK
jgi:hypothetical protein